VVGNGKCNYLLRTEFRAIAGLRSIPAIGYIALMLGAIQVGLSQQGKLAFLPVIGADDQAVAEFSWAGGFLRATGRGSRG
jgi:hypothetical protein